MPGLPRPPKRFNLLLLDEGEVYFDDYAAYYFAPGVDDDVSLQRRVEGRLKLCSASVLFVPKDTFLPIIKFPFKFVERVDTWQGPYLSCAPTKEDIFLLQGSLTVEMKENDRNAPYRFKKGRFEHRFSLIYESISQFLPNLLTFHSLALLKAVDPRAERDMLESLLLRREQTVTFDPSWFIHIMEHKQLEVRASRVTPFVSNPGRLVLTDRAVYFQLFNNIDSTPVSKLEYRHVHRICTRRHALRHIGLEIFYLPPDFTDVSSFGKRESVDHSLESIFFSFRDRSTRERVYTSLRQQAAVLHAELDDLEDVTIKWQHGLITNFDYLLHLNALGGRSYMDIAQYPVFPWVLADYTSDHLDLADIKVFRDLKLPVGALNPERLKRFLDRYNDIPNDQPKFHYGTHYSTPGYVLYFMVRRSPEYMLRLQNGKFDEPARLFHSIQETFYSALNSSGDVKELIPEFFFSDGDFLLNNQSLDLGSLSDGRPIGDVSLPPWAGDSKQFIAINRDALESPYVSKNLHHWIDLIFGYKQQGEEAVRAYNLFYHLTYEGAVDVEGISDVTERAAMEAQIHEFGQTPRKIFRDPHPQRIAEVTKGWVFGKYPCVTPPSSAWHNVQPLSDIPSTSPSPGRSGDMSFYSPSSTSSFSSSSSSLPHPSLPSASNSFSALPTSPEAFRKSQSNSSVSRGASNSSAKESVPQEARKWGKGRFEHLFTEKPHRGNVTSLCVTQDGDLLLSVGKDGRLKVYSLSKRTVHRSLVVSQVPLSACVLDAEDKTALAACWDGRVYLYSLDCGKVLHTHTAHDDAVSSLALTRGSKLVSGSWDATVKVWECGGGNIDKHPLHFYELEEAVRCCDVLPDNVSPLAAAGASDGSLSILDFRAQKVVRTIHNHTDAVTAVRLRYDTFHILSSGADGHLRYHDLRMGEVASLTVGSSSITCFDCDAESVLFGTSDGDVHIASIGAGDLSVREALPPPRHAGAVCSLASTRRGDVVVSGGEDSCVNAWGYVE